MMNIMVSMEEAWIIEIFKQDTLYCNYFLCIEAYNVSSAHFNFPIVQIRKYTQCHRFTCIRCKLG